MDFKKKIVLIGFMGSGKTTLGKKLANKLNFSFVDLDEVIVAYENMPITLIFKTKGEDYFRKIESEKLIEILTKKENLVISTGGGTPCFYNNMQWINNNAISFYLKYSPAFLRNRLMHAKENRPLIQQFNNAQLLQYIEQKLLERAIFYEKSDYVIEEINIKTNHILHKLIQCEKWKV